MFLNLDRDRDGFIDLSDFEEVFDAPGDAQIAFSLFDSVTLYFLTHVSWEPNEWTKDK